MSREQGYSAVLAFTATQAYNSAMAVESFPNGGAFRYPRMSSGHGPNSFGGEVGASVPSSSSENFLHPHVSSDLQIGFSPTTDNDTHLNVVRSMVTQLHHKTREASRESDPVSLRLDRTMVLHRLDYVSGQTDVPPIEEGVVSLFELVLAGEIEAGHVYGMTDLVKVTGQSGKVLDPILLNMQRSGIVQKEQQFGVGNKKGYTFIDKPQIDQTRDDTFDDELSTSLLVVRNAAYEAPTTDSKARILRLGTIELFDAALQTSLLSYHDDQAQEDYETRSPSWARRCVAEVLYDSLAQGMIDDKTVYEAKDFIGHFTETSSFTIREGLRILTDAGIIVPSNEAPGSFSFNTSNILGGTFADQEIPELPLDRRISALRDSDVTDPREIALILNVSVTDVMDILSADLATYHKDPPMQADIYVDGIPYKRVIYDGVTLLVPDERKAE